MKKTLLTLSLFTAVFGISKAQNFQSYEKTIPNTTVKFKMVAIPAGELSMGSPESESGHEPDESPQVKVKLSAFWMGATEVTYDEYQLFFEEERDPEPCLLSYQTRRCYLLTLGYRSCYHLQCIDES